MAAGKKWLREGSWAHASAEAETLLRKLGHKPIMEASGAVKCAACSERAEIGRTENKRTGERRYFIVGPRPYHDRSRLLDKCDNPRMSEAEFERERQKFMRDKWGSGWDK